MILHQKYFQAAEIDLQAAKILSESNCFQPALYHLQQAYEKCVKSYYVFLLTSDGVPEKKAYKKCKEKLGHDTQESTIKLLIQLTQKEINKLQKELKKQTDPDVKKAIQDVLAAIKGYKESMARMVKRHNLQTNYKKNVKDYTRLVQHLYDYNQKSAIEVLSTQPEQKLLSIDLTMATLYPCFFKMEEITRYPLTEFSCNNLDLLTNMKKPCQNIIEMMTDLFSLVKEILS